MRGAGIGTDERRCGIDERAWFYVAEESGHVRAYASAPQLSLVK